MGPTTSTSTAAAAVSSVPSAPRRAPRSHRRPSQLRAASTAAPPSPDLSIQLSPRTVPLVTPPSVSASFARNRAEDLQAEARAMARAVNATVFSPDLLASRYGSRPFKVALRAAEVLSKLGAFGLKLLLDERSGHSSAMRRARAVELRTILTRLGPTFVKIGQGLSTRPDLCPPEYLEELSELQETQESSLSQPQGPLPEPSFILSNQPVQRIIPLNTSTVAGRAALAKKRKASTSQKTSSKKTKASTSRSSKRASQVEEQEHADIV